MQLCTSNLLQVPKTLPDIDLLLFGKHASERSNLNGIINHIRRPFIIIVFYFSHRLKSQMVLNIDSLYFSGNKSHYQNINMLHLFKCQTLIRCKIPLQKFHCVNEKWMLFCCSQWIIKKFACISVDSFCLAKIE